MGSGSMGSGAVQTRSKKNYDLHRSEPAASIPDPIVMQEPELPLAQATEPILPTSRMPHTLPTPLQTAPTLFQSQSSATPSVRSVPPARGMGLSDILGSIGGGL